MAELTQLNINPQEVLLYLGWRGAEPEADLMETIDRCAEAVLAAAQPKVIYRRFFVENGHFSGTNLHLQGQDILRHLEGCAEAILMAATLGPKVESLLMRTEVVDMAKALIMDSCASAAIENLCDRSEAQLRSDIEREGAYLTDRFSPGYGDLPITHQKTLCDVLDTQRRMGLAVSQSGILIPRKSVTAVLGVSSVPRVRRSSGCANCNLFYRCQIRKGGGYCNK